MLTALAARVTSNSTSLTRPDALAAEAAVDTLRQLLVPGAPSAQPSSSAHEVPCGHLLFSTYCFCHVTTPAGLGCCLFMMTSHVEFGTPVVAISQARSMAVCAVRLGVLHRGCRRWEMSRNG